MPYSEFKRRWSEEDVGLILEYLSDKNSICQKCGTHPDEWLDENGKLVEPPPYVTKTLKCHGCATLEEARGSVPQEEKGSIEVLLSKVSRKAQEKVHSRWQMKKSKSK